MHANLILASGLERNGQQRVAVAGGEGAVLCHGLNGTLQLHDGIVGIMNDVFAGVPLKGELALPKNLTSIGERAFEGCDFSGELKLPKNLVSIGQKAFAYNWRLMGVLEFPEGIQSIGAGAFANCRSIEGLV